MTEFTTRDIGIFISLTIATIAISFAFPAMGLGGDEVGENEIPQYNASNEAFDYLAEQDRPEFPSRPSEGTLRYVDNQSVYQDNRRVWLEGSTADGGYEITLTNNGTINDPAASLFLNEYDGTSFVGANSTEMDESDEFDTLERDGYVIAFSNVTFSNVGDNDMTMTVDWEIAETPAGASAVGRIPVVGSLYSSTANAIAGIIDVLGWIGDISLYVGELLTVGTLGVFTFLYNIGSFILSSLFWLISTYTGIISGAPTGWESVIVAIPGMLMSLYFMKAVMAFATLLPGVG